MNGLVSGIRLRFGSNWHADSFAPAVFAAAHGINAESSAELQAPAWPDPWPSVFLDSEDGKIGDQIEAWCSALGLKGKIYRSNPDAFQMTSRRSTLLLSSLGSPLDKKIQASWVRAQSSEPMGMMKISRSEISRLKELRNRLNEWDPMDSARAVLGSPRCAWFEGSWDDCRALWPKVRQTRRKHEFTPRGWWIEMQLEIDQKSMAQVPLALTPFFSIQMDGAPAIYGYSRRDEQGVLVRIRTMAPWSEESLGLSWQRKYLARALRATYQCIPGLEWCAPKLVPDFAPDDSLELRKKYGFKKLADIPVALRVLNDNSPRAVVSLKNRVVARWKQILQWRTQTPWFWREQSILRRTYCGHPCFIWFEVSRIKSWL